MFSFCSFLWGSLRGIIVFSHDSNERPRIVVDYVMKLVKPWYLGLWYCWGSVLFKTHLNQSSDDSDSAQVLFILLWFFFICLTLLFCVSQHYSLIVLTYYLYKLEIIFLSFISSFMLVSFYFILFFFIKHLVIFLKGCVHKVTHLL